MREPAGVALAPVEGALPESGLRQRIRNGVAEAGEALEFVAPSLAHRLAELAWEVAEEEEGLPAAPLLAHEEERRRRREKQDCRERFQNFFVSQNREPFPERPIADLVMVLQEVHEAGERQVRARLAAPPAAEGRDLALVGEAFGEAPRQVLRRRIGVGDVVAVGLAGREHVVRVVRVVVPLRGVAPGADQARLVRVVLEHEVLARGHGGADLLQDVARRLVDDGVHRVEAKPVEAVLLEPVERVVHEVLAHHFVREVDRRTPGGAVAAR